MDYIYVFSSNSGTVLSASANIHHTINMISKFFSTRPIEKIVVVDADGNRNAVETADAAFDAIMNHIDVSRLEFKGSRIYWLNKIYITEA